MIASLDDDDDDDVTGVGDDTTTAATAVGVACTSYIAPMMGSTVTMNTIAYNGAPDCAANERGTICDGIATPVIPSRTVYAVDATGMVNTSVRRLANELYTITWKLTPAVDVMPQIETFNKRHCSHATIHRQTYMDVYEAHE